MQIISSYGVELRKQNIPIRQTLEIYRSAVSYLIGIYVQVWEKLAEIPDAKRRFNAAEHLVHTTKKNHACFAIIILQVQPGNAADAFQPAADCIGVQVERV